MGEMTRIFSPIELLPSGELGEVVGSGLVTVYRPTGLERSRE